MVTKQFHSKKNKKHKTERKEKEIIERREITIQSLLESGAQYGSTISTWNPKYAPYIFCLRQVKPNHRSQFARNRTICVIYLDETYKQWEKAREKLVTAASKGKNILIVSNKPVTKDILAREAEETKVHHITNKWLPGLLTNFEVIQKNIARYNALSKFIAGVDDGTIQKQINKKEILFKRRELTKLHKDYFGIRNLKTKPDLIFVVDTRENALAVQESSIAQIETIGIVDTDSDPTKVGTAIPANDDAANTVALFIRASIDAIKEGQQQRVDQLEAEKKLDEVTESI